MSRLVKKRALSVEAPLCIDSTEAAVIEAALKVYPGSALVNSINLEAGRDKLDTVVPLAIEHGAAVIALTIDEVGMAKTVERKIEIAFVPIAGTRVLVPFRMTIPTPFGPAMLEATSFITTAAPPRVAKTN